MHHVLISLASLNLLCSDAPAAFGSSRACGLGCPVRAPGMLFETVASLEVPTCCSWLAAASLAMIIVRDVVRWRCQERADTCQVLKAFRDSLQQLRWAARETLRPSGPWAAGDALRCAERSAASASSPHDSQMIASFLPMTAASDANQVATAQVSASTCI